MQIKVGRNQLTLTKNDFLAAGGQGQVYVRNGIAYKIYFDPSTMIPLQKIAELSSLSNANIIKPEDAIYDGSKAIGYSMRFIKDGIPLCQIFTKAYRERNKIDPSMMVKLVKKLQEIVQNAHDGNALIVDLNEMNFLTNDNGWDQVFAIDVDSWQTKSFPAVAIMDSIRDRHTKGFSKGTDWFSFGIVSFQMFIGIHPFKGKHPTIKGIDDRMLQNLSVLNQSVSIPPACYDFSVIPKNYLAWYKAVFEEGKRVAPPFDSDLLQVVAVVKRIVEDGAFVIRKAFKCDSNIVTAVYFGQDEIVISEDKAFFNRKECRFVDKINCIVETDKKQPLFITQVGNRAKTISALSGREVSLDVHVDSMLSYHGRAYIKSGMNILEVEFREMGINILALTTVVSTVLPNTSLRYEGCIIQEMINSKVLTVFPETKTSYQIVLKELANQRIVSAKFDSGVLIVLATRGGKYEKFIFRFAEDYSEYDVRSVPDIQPISINFTVLDSGVVCHVTEEDVVELFPKGIRKAGIKSIQSNQMDISKMVHKGPSGVQFIDGDTLYTMRMK